jgi:hypothetical protein
MVGKKTSPTDEQLFISLFRRKRKNINNEDIIQVNRNSIQNNRFG